MVNLKSLTPSETAILQKMVDLMTMHARLDYAHYRNQGGVVFKTFEATETAIKLARKGWIEPEPDLLSDQMSWLTREAWDRFSLAEWSKIEEERLNEERGEIGGSW